MHIKIEPVSGNDTWYNHPTYQKAKERGDCGLDIPMHESIIVPANARSFSIFLGISTEPSHAYILVPRSSITKTPLRMANSVGIIDQGFRGHLIAKVDNRSNEPFTVEFEKCYFQIVAFDGNLPTWEIGCTSRTIRGVGGFGSTTD